MSAMHIQLTACAEDIPHIVEIAIGFVEHSLALSAGARPSPSNLRRLREGQSFPFGLAIEYGATVFLSQLEEARILVHDGVDLPTTGEALTSILARLHKNPQSFWADATPGQELHRRVLERWSKYDWRSFGTTTVAVVNPQPDQFLEALADFLWKHRHLGRASTGHESALAREVSQSRSLLAYFKTTTRTRRRKHASAD